MSIFTNNLQFSVIDMKKISNNNESFGQRLAKIRKAKGITQIELGKKLGVSQRVITYYERETQRPPAVYLPLIAKILHVRIDELLGIKQLKDKETSNSIRMLKKLKKTELLPPKDQKAVVHYIEALLSKQANKG